MGFLSPPKPPSPVATANAQAQANIDAAREAAKLNAVDQYGPFGSTTFQRDPKTGIPLSQTVELSPEIEAWLNSQIGLSGGLSDAATAQLENLPQDKFTLPEGSAQDFVNQTFGPGGVFNSPGYNGQVNEQSISPTASTKDIGDTFYEQAKSRFQPDIDAARKQKEVELGQRGIPVGSEIWNDEMNRLDRSANNAYSDAARQAELASGAEQSRQFGQNLSTAQFGSSEDARSLANEQFLSQFMSVEDARRLSQTLSANQFGHNQYQTEVANKTLERNRPFEELAAYSGAAPKFSTPSFVATAPQGVNAPNIADLIQQNYQSQVAQNNSMMSGIAGLGGSLISLFSDENMKKNRKPADGANILLAFREMPVDDYEYREDARREFGLPEHRTGTMAQDYAEHFGGDGVTIDVGDALGKLMAAVKALDKRTMSKRKYA